MSNDYFNCCRRPTNERRDSDRGDDDVEPGGPEHTAALQSDERRSQTQLGRFAELHDVLGQSVLPSSSKSAHAGQAPLLQQTRLERELALQRG